MFEITTTPSVSPYSSHEPLTESEFRSQIESIWDAALAKSHIEGSAFRREARSFAPRSRAQPSNVVRRQLERAQSALEQERAKEKELIIRDCYEIYRNAFEGSLNLLVIGSDALRSDNIETKNFGTLSQEPGLKKVKDGRELKKGAILFEGKWMILKNDAAMLGAIHAGKLMAVHKLPGEDLTPDVRLLWDEEQHRPRVMGRELIMLEASGYSRVTKNPKEELLGVYFAPSPTADEEPLISLPELYHAAEKVKDIETIYSFFSGSKYKEGA